MKAFVILFSLVLSTQIFAAKTGVKWFEGGIESAMKVAKRKNMPMFLYWGAVWCPPCNQIKKTIFTKPKFHKEAQKFISVYLDGDKPNAQKWGEHFGTKGYPTMMILNSSGEEISRMPGGLNVDQYVKLMQKTRENQLSIKEIFNRVKTGKATLGEFERLAGYSWSQDIAYQDTLLSKENKAKTFKTIFEKAPSFARAVKAKFFLQYHLAMFENNEEYQADQSDIKEFEKVLTSQSALQRNASIITYYPGEYKRIFGKKMGLDKFKKVYLAAMDKIMNDETLDNNDRFTAVYPEIFLNTKDNKTPKTTQEKVKKWAAKVDKESTDPFSRQSNITTAIWILKAANLIPEAKKIALAELDKSISPFYIMRYLASIEIALDNKKEAMKWSKKAWQTSKGSATRFEWGTSYLLNLMKHTPKNEKEITSTTESVFSELISQSGDAFEGRNKKRLGRLQKSFEDWKKEHNDAFFGMSANLNNKCRKSINQDIRKRCVKWVKKL